METSQVCFVQLIQNKSVQKNIISTKQILALKSKCDIVAISFFYLSLFFKYMSVEFEKAKTDVLGHIEALLEEIEQEIALSHQEKYALLEDAFGSASDVDELRVAFDQWFMEHSEDIGFDHTVDEIWDHALGGEHSYASGDDEDDDEDKIFEEAEAEEEEEDEDDDVVEGVFDDEDDEN
ncbi:MAG: hypothetical protein CO029_04495 [Candidatus Magasanikbacteria bacterium CG_4_9_14_0_2_um_filter_41_10]|uniref:Uncharacterized protein n=1 Tax=Candidatus Magasanikbacteria bacterium CG_4_10_14_0_2_um_filter_41_31 TaxID=1974639 RepID=A0A2M7V1P5_9BACT|nr:MAG: hypothetical protein AUJ37_03950 [Candidatus Magasanikbacteria bacterium CG1_02_41_34]PIZ92250.1 MAG: hypothetical protein COX83_04845 [Candidatus Magasanikbacteria bacterium CG_4_10_14_0_2_um_filter_41_31]PJC53118.1 MAG: hypothetical protein CO029_04495 [Candidatus Magasanikbacteria bacterium CG_4_9_14_0_2_um_filter_41_10]